MERKANIEERYYSEKCKMLADVFSRKYIIIAEVDLETATVLIIKSNIGQLIEEKRLSWAKAIDYYTWYTAFPEDKKKIRSLTLEKMKKILEKSEEEDFTMELRCFSKKKEYMWIEVNIIPIFSQENKLLITAHNISKDKIIKSIVDLFVFKNYDYLTLIDTKRNSYITLSRSESGTPVPPISGEDYEQDMIQYNKQFVVPEDCERVTANMRILHIIKMLEEKDAYGFQSGGLEKDGTYRRSRIQFTYYDKAAGLVLLSRINVTQIYLEEQEKNLRLSEAMRAASHDALTGIYNQKAVFDLVSCSLESQYRRMAALLFIDVDNFKMVNDTLGHQKGDELLKYLADFINRIAEKDGIAGRIGGDEFLLYLPIIEKKEIVNQKGRKICTMFDTFTDTELKGLPITCSVGISLYPQDGTDYKTLLCKADQALYHSKRYGKSQYYFYSESINPIH